MYQVSPLFFSDLTNPLEAIYQCINAFILPTISLDDEYIVIVFEIMSEELILYYGGNYLVQQWAKKQKIF